MFGLTAAAGLSLSISDHSHHVLTYILWYGAAAFALIVAIAATIVIDRRLASDAPPTGALQPLSPPVVAGQEAPRGPAPPDQAVAAIQAPRVFDEAPPELADMSSASLKELFAGRTDAQGAKLTEHHVGKSVRVSGDVAKVELGTVNSVTIKAAVTMLLLFAAGDAEQLLALNLGDKVVVSGQIYGLSDGFVCLHKCKLVEARGHAA